jgi:putative ABC transport system permease protein
MSGKYFADESRTPGVVEAIVSQSAGKVLWPGESPLGKLLRRSNTPADWMTVVGVVEDVMLDNFREAEPAPIVYLPLVGHTPQSWMVGTPAYVVKSARAETIAPEVRELIRQFSPTAPMYRVFTMRNLAERSMAELSFLMFTLAIASGITLVLGTVGMYGTLSYMVSQRTSEIGLRMALGAQTSEVRRMIVSYGGRIALVGVGIGLAAAVFLTRSLNELLFRTAAVDMTTLLGVSLIMLGVAALASYVPAKRASSVEPIESLRTE